MMFDVLFVLNRERMGPGLMIETSKNPICPKVGFNIYLKKKCNSHLLTV